MTTNYNVIFRPHPNTVKFNYNLIEKIKSTNLIIICRSGARSRSAAEFLTTQGYNNCYNLSDGFEGGHDSSSHRGKVNGWKFSGLPWKQG